MNNKIVEEIKIEFERVSQFHSNKLFTVEYLEHEYQKIVSAREIEYPTYRSEYRVIKTLIQQRNQTIYQLQKSEDGNPKEVLQEIITIS